MNSFGESFRVSILGESHGEVIGVLIDGCPAGIPLTPEDMSQDLDRRKAGKKGTTPRKESDLPKILSGLLNGHTTGSPLLVLFENKNTQSKDYETLAEIPRPGHADFVAWKRFGPFRDHRGGGPFSGRLTLGLVAAGTVAKKIVPTLEFHSQILEIGGENDYEQILDEALNAGDSLGGIIEMRVCQVPIGLGEPFFQSVESQLAQVIFSIPGIKGIEFGSGFQAARMRGSAHNDPYVDLSGKTNTNHAGGINGGLTNGNDIVFRVAVKPTSSIRLKQRSINIKTGQLADLEIKGRHDACFALRVPVIIEAVTAIVLADLAKQQRQSV